MPLNLGHQNFIEGILTYLLEFSDDADTFVEEAHTLHQALTTDIPETHDFFQLREYLIKPESKLQRLEESGPITIGEVQAYLMRHITSKIQAHAAKIAVALNTDVWNTENLCRNIIADENTSKPFQSQVQATPPQPHPWDMPPLDNRIYQRRLSIRTTAETFPVAGEEAPLVVTTRQAYVQVTVYCNEDFPDEDEIFLCDIPKFSDDTATDDRETDRYVIETIMTQAEDAAIWFAAKTARDYLDEAESDPDLACDIIMTHQYYYEQIYNGEIDFSSTEGLHVQTARMLLHPSIVHLQKCEILDFTAATELTNAEYAIICHHAYHRRLVSGQFMLADIQGCNHHQAHFLTHPQVSNLIVNNKLPLTHARAMPLHLMPVLTANIYHRYFLTTAIDWERFRDIDERQAKLAMHPDFTKFIINQVVCFSEMQPGFHYDTVFSKRLQQLFNGTPYVINGQADTILILAGEMPYAAFMSGMAPIALRHSALGQLLQNLKTELLTHADNATPQAAALLRSMAEIIPSFSLHHPLPNWDAIFTQLLTNARLNRPLAVNTHRFHHTADTAIAAAATEERSQRSPLPWIETLYNRLSAIATLVPVAAPSPQPAPASQSASSSAVSACTPLKKRHRPGGF